MGEDSLNHVQGSMKGLSMKVIVEFPKRYHLYKTPSENIYMNGDHISAVCAKSEGGKKPSHF